MPVGGGGLTTSPGAVTHKLEADFSGAAFGGTPTWTDITGWWMSGGSDPGGSPATMPWGRQDQSSTVESSTTSFVLNNADGRFTPGKALLVNGSANPYYPNVRRRVRMRETITDGTTTLTMFDGYVDSWTVTVQTNGPTLSTVSLSDTFARLSASTVLRAMVVEEMLADAPAALYPLGDMAGSISAEDVTGKQPEAQVKTSKYGAATLAFGNPTSLLGLAGMVTVSSPDSGSATSSARATYLSVPKAVPSSGAFTVTESFVAPSVIPAAQEQVAYLPSHTGATGGFGEVSIYINPGDGKLVVSITGMSIAGTTSTVTVSSLASACDGKPHTYGVTLSANLGGTVGLVLDGVSQGTGVFGGTILWTNLSQFWSLGVLVANAVEFPFSGSFALFGQYAGVLSTARLAIHYNAGASTFAGESTATRFARLATYRPNLGVTSTGTMGTVGAGDIAGMSLGAAFEDTATAEGGVLQTNRGTTTLIGRSNWYDPATTLTLDAANGEVDLPTTWRDDTQALVNDVTVSRPNGADQRAVNTASTTGTDGVAQTSITANLNSDRDAADMAGWLVAVGVREQLDSPTLTVNLYARASSALTMAVCALKTYDVVTLINLPASAPASTMSFQVQGGTPTVGADTFTVELYTTTMPPTVLRTDATADTYTLLDSGLKIGW